MRKRTFGAMGAATLLTLAACGSEEAEEAEVPEVASGTASVEIEGSLPEPAHGGTVLAAGEHPIEVIAQEDGYVDAYVLADEPPPPEQTQVTVHVPADDGEVHPVLLVWDPSESRYRGRLRRVRPVPGPIEVVFVARGQSYRGRAPRVVVVAPGARPGVVLDRGRGRPNVRVRTPDGPRARVEVDAPRPPGATVEVRHPGPPRPNVVVRHRRPSGPNVVVEHPGPPRPGVVVRHRAPSPRTVVVREPDRPRGRVRVRHDNGLHRGHDRGRGRGRGHGRGRGRDDD